MNLTPHEPKRSANETCGAETEPPAELPWEVDVKEASRRLTEEPETVLLDCREPDEYELVHLPDSVLIPISRMVEQASLLERLRSRHVLVICHHGIRSLGVTRWLREQGWPQVQSVAGGIDRWAVELDPQLPRY